MRLQGTFMARQSAIAEPLHCPFRRHRTHLAEALRGPKFMASIDASRWLKDGAPVLLLPVVQIRAAVILQVQRLVLELRRVAGSLATVNAEI